MRRQGGKLHAPADEEPIASDEEALGALACESSKGRIDLADRTGVEDLDLQTDARGRFLHLMQRGLGD